MGREDWERESEISLRLRRFTEISLFFPLETKRKFGHIVNSAFLCGWSSFTLLELSLVSAWLMLCPIPWDKPHPLAAYVLCACFPWGQRRDSQVTLYLCLATVSETILFFKSSYLMERSFPYPGPAVCHSGCLSQPQAHCPLLPSHGPFFPQQK